MTEQSAPTIDESRDPSPMTAERSTATTRPPRSSAGRRTGPSNQTFVPADDGSAERRYVLDMFPYPSGDLHMGHAEAFVMGDIVARHLKLQGYDVLHPIGWDSFGLPAENAAIKNNTHPAEWTYANIETQATSFQRYGLSFDWSRRLHTSDPEYYRWTQWLFLKFRERGLAYRKASYVNWCPNDQTVLANEQVVNGACERCGAVVTKRQLTQWYFKTTEYAQRLLDDMAELEGGWPERVLAMQRNWIGRSEGAYVDFEIDGLRRAGDRLHHPPGHPVRRDVLRGRARGRAGRRDRRGRVSGPSSRRTWSRPSWPPRSSARPPTGPRPASSWACTRPTR